jgi:hypothetical protein
MLLLLLLLRWHRVHAHWSAGFHLVFVANIRLDDSRVAVIVVIVVSAGGLRPSLL